VGGRRQLAAGLAAALLLAACGPERTPLPVVPVATETPPPSTVAVRLRYALDETAAAALGPLVDGLRAVGEVSIVSTVDAQAAEVLLSAVPIADGSALERPFPAWIALDETQPPLNQPGIASEVRAALDAVASGAQGSESARAVRTALANAGFPDGVTLRINGALAQTTALSAFGIRLRDSADAPHLSVRYGADMGEGGVGGFAVTLYVWAAPGQALRLNEDGLPVPAG